MAKWPNPPALIQFCTQPGPKTGIPLSEKAGSDDQMKCGWYSYSIPPMGNSSTEVFLRKSEVKSFRVIAYSGVILIIMIYNDQIVTMD